MTTEDIEVIVSMMTRQETPFLLVAVADDGGIRNDYYYCHGSEQVATENLIAATIGNAARHLLDEGNTTESIQQVFSDIVQEAERQYTEDSKILS